VILACYDLTLYCDFCERNWPSGTARPTTITGGSRGDALALARRKGWRLDWKRDRAKCPTCVLAKRTKVRAVAE